MENNEPLSSAEETARYIHLMQGLPELTDELKSKIQEYIGKIPDMLASYKSDTSTRDMINAAIKEKTTRDLGDKDTLLIGSLLKPEINVEPDSKERVVPLIGFLAAGLGLTEGAATLALGSTIVTGIGAGYAYVKCIFLITVPVSIETCSANVNYFVDITYLPSI